VAGLLARSCSQPGWSDSHGPSISLLIPSALDVLVGQEKDSATERAVAGVASYMLPGGVQFYRGEWGKGGVMLGGFAASLVYAVWAGIGPGEYCTDLQGQPHCHTTPYAPNGHFWVGLGSAVGFQLWSVLDALSPSGR
jgi:hypothetical protein